jgi:hypothetical protein
MSKQFELTRKSLMHYIKELDERTADVQPPGFNNTIRWHIGHVLTAAEGFMFGYPDRSSNIPASYRNMFGMGSKPSDWSSDIPTLQELNAHFRSQTGRIQELSEEFFAQKLPFEFPFGNIQTFGELFELMLYHEAEHLGKMKAMKRFIEA